MLLPLVRGKIPQVRENKRDHRIGRPENSDRSFRIFFCRQGGKLRVVTLLPPVLPWEGRPAAAAVQGKNSCTPIFAVQYLAAVITTPPPEDGYPGTR